MKTYSRYSAWKSSDGTWAVIEEEFWFGHEESLAHPRYRRVQEDMEREDAEGLVWVLNGVE